MKHTPPTHRPYTNRIESLLKELNAGIYEKEQAVRLVLLAFISGKSCFLYGPPGTAKSLIARRVALAFETESKAQSPQASTISDTKSCRAYNTIDSSRAESSPASNKDSASTESSALDSKKEASKKAESTTTDSHTVESSKAEPKKAPSTQTHSFFAYLMNRFSTPEEIFGPIDIAELKQNRLTRSTQGYLPTAHFAFLDEIWKSSPAILNTLLTIINEKIYRDGNADIKVPLKGLVCASNEFPPPNQGLEALYDRLLIRLCVLPVEGKKSFESLLQAQSKEVKISNPITPSELDSIQSQAREVSFSKAALQAIHTLRKLIKAHNNSVKKASDDLDLESSQDSKEIYISDRRWRAMAELLQSAALLSDRAEVLPIDITLLAHCLWSDEAQRETIQSLLEKAIKESTHYAEVDEIERIDAEFGNLMNDDKSSDEEDMEACKKIIDSITRLHARLDDKYCIVNPFVSRSDYKLALHGITELQKRVYETYEEVICLKEGLECRITGKPILTNKPIIPTQLAPIKRNTPKLAIYHPRTKEELQKLIEDSSISLWEIDTSAITDMSLLFHRTKREDFSGIEYWNVSSVEDMGLMFYGVKDFNEPLGAWNVSNVKDMNGMFLLAKSFNQPLDSWNVGNVRDMNGMFECAYNFNQALNSWNVEKVTKMRLMFKEARSFNQPLDSWNVSNVNDMSYMFCGASSFNQVLDSWKVGDTTDTAYMFALTSCPRPKWK